jgi:ribonuclease H2 subunit B
MKMIATQKGPDDLKAFVFDEEKTLKWLKIKFSRIQESLRKQNIISSGSSSANFVDSLLIKNESENEDEIAATALGIISEYISLNLYEKLDNIYGISAKSKEPIAQQKRKSETKNSNEPDSKKIKSELEVQKENKAQPAKATAKSAKLEKAAKGSKSISSFFSKK